jgi:hypothetical protein
MAAIGISKLEDSITAHFDVSRSKKKTKEGI